LLTKKEKAWFFLLCGYQSKINELIFLVICLSLSANLTMHKVCHQSHGSYGARFFYAEFGK
ncbi:hypothetical protein, partial [Klebsiella aerogenes]|uniref:hypothetical protein n=1 Tax=Klebsiella aerogenes TaxID=548 RepID=UPI000949A7B8